MELDKDLTLLEEVEQRINSLQREKEDLKLRVEKINCILSELTWIKNRLMKGGK